MSEAALLRAFAVACINRHGQLAAAQRAEQGERRALVYSRASKRPPTRSDSSRMGERGAGKPLRTTPLGTTPLGTTPPGTAHPWSTRTPWILGVQGAGELLIS